MNKIDPHYFDLQIYAIYRAIWERWGEEAWHVVWCSGEVLFDEIEPTLGLTTDDTPFDAMRCLADYLRQVGYVDDISVRQTGEYELEYEMLNPVILAGAKRLIAEGAVPAHISTTLMFALLRKRFGLKAEMIGDPRLLPDGRGIERWKLSELEE
jgi:hypothetical protein